ncbi:hypothetical protein JRO89_XS06G0224500 [Xanthoceras sorbifolium]|uniref:Peptidase A2 domain-containing protein n=1 Tax=Xanthoceras sorbifolium TaxID=99658 RepID=A0ABQ8HZL9_9ROSI|nr:hypothetical protein JRO89_XS06G0224500 [Xanthoceras sorbifolium]
MSGRTGRRGINKCGICILMTDDKMEPSTAKMTLKGNADSLNRIRVSLPFQWGAPSFDAGEAFAMIMATFWYQSRVEKGYFLILLCNMTLAEAKERIGLLEKIVGEPPSENVPEIAVMCVAHEERILTLQKTVIGIWKDMEVRINNVRLEQAGVVDMMTEKIRAMSDEIAILHRGKSIEGKFGKNKDWKKKAADGRKEKEVEAKGKEPMQSKNSGYFICSGPHCARDCPMKERVSALISQGAETSDSDADVVRANCVQLLNTIRVVKQPPYDLMQVQVQVNGKCIRALLDTGADSNYLAQHMVDGLGLTVSKSSKRVKAVNLGTVAVLGETEIEVGLGTWHGRCMMNVIPLVDFEMVLGIEFFVKAKVNVRAIE